MPEHAPFQTVAADARATARLYRWLAADESLRPEVFVGRGSPSDTPEPPEGPDHLGDPVEIISVVVSSLLALPAFVASVRRWFDHEPSPAPVVLRRGEVTVEVPTDTDTTVVAALTQALLAEPANTSDPTAD
ncbi:hypothetical protein [Streptomyces sp. NPDC096142]|uniref:effector-associated constant component EACC1 n=1 Tax=Streptomyces sp. NPDC096142 TaxID=3366077 RepID=UPI00381D6193